MNSQQPTPHKEFRIKGGDRILSMIRSFSTTEKVIFGGLAVVAVVSALIMAWKVNKSFLIPIPAHGGSVSEGVVGLPRSINPVLAFTDVDKDMTTLVYAGLMKYKDGEIVPDMAQSYAISDDGLVYSFTLKDDIRFHDGTPLTADDVEFTMQKIQDASLKSPRAADWAGVTIRKIGTTQLEFILKKPYAPFLANTTIGILPKHIWKNVDAEQFIFSQYNIEPIGSGPYAVDSIKRDKGGIPQSYQLESFSRYHEGEPYISTISVYFYPNEKAALEAYDAGVIDNLGGVSPSETAAIAASNHGNILHAPLPRVFGIFFNQSNAPVLANREVRQALDMAVDKEKIIDEVLYGYGISISSPVPADSATSSGRQESNKGDKQAALTLLAKNGWAVNAAGVLEKKTKTGTQTLEFSIATTDAPDLKKTAELLKSEWEQLGASVTVKVFEYGDLSQNIIKTRKYDALLFGEAIGKDLDLYAFWHSSQRNAPGLNVAMYVNSRVDTILEDARSTADPAARAKLYASFETIIHDEVPAVFLYSPEYIYLVSDRIKGMEIGHIANPADRWYGINTWHTANEYVWKIFMKDIQKSEHQ